MHTRLLSLLFPFFSLTKQYTREEKKKENEIQFSPEIYTCALYTSLGPTRRTSVHNKHKVHSTNSGLKKYPNEKNSR